MPLGDLHLMPRNALLELAPAARTDCVLMAMERGHTVREIATHFDVTVGLVQRLRFAIPIPFKATGDSWQLHSTRPLWTPSKENQP